MGADKQSGGCRPLGAMRNGVRGGAAALMLRCVDGAPCCCADTATISIVDAVGGSPHLSRGTARRIVPHLTRDCSKDC